MSIEEKQIIADAADMIVDGYSFTYKDGNVLVVNPNEFWSEEEIDKLCGI